HDADDGIVLLDGSLRVLHANAQAQAILEAREALTVSERRLIGRNPRADNELQTLLRAALNLKGSPAGGWLALDRRDRAPLLLRVTRVMGAAVTSLLPSTALVARIKDPDRDRSPSPVVLQRLLGLT